MTNVGLRSVSGRWLGVSSMGGKPARHAKLPASHTHHIKNLGRIEEDAA